jgi:hypothetical protein
MNFGGFKETGALYAQKTRASLRSFMHGLDRRSAKMNDFIFPRQSGNISRIMVKFRVGKCSVSEILSITFKYLLEILSLRVG